MSRTGTDRKGVWIDATIHAREWLATTTHLKIMQHVDSFALLPLISRTQHC